MDSAGPKRSLADDPSFLERLSALDEGLGGDAARPRARRIKPPTSGAARASVSPFPVPAATDNSAAVEPPPRRRRPLIDLFPPSSAPAATAPPPGPVRGTASPPKLARAAVRRAAAATPPGPRPQTYETFYGLSEKPFALEPDARFLYHSTAHDRAAQELLEAIRQRAGAIVVTGPAGIGKTTLCRVVLDQLDRRTLTSFVTEPVATIDEFVGALLVDFGVLSREELVRQSRGDAGQMPGALRSFVESLAPLQASAVVVIDEAQRLPAGVLHELQRMTADMLPTLQIVLVRNHERRRHSREHARIVVDGLVEDEVPGYVMHRLSVAGQQPRVDFDDGAMRLLFALSRGNPRTINQLCDRALTRGFDRSASVIDADLVDLAADELGVSAPDAASAAQSLAITVVLLLLMTIGAGSAAWVFRDRLQSAISAWVAMPAPPAPPRVNPPPPLVPIAEPR